MFDFIEGQLVELTPTSAILQVGGLGYAINISLNTYVSLDKDASCRLYLHHVVREDAQLLYGFFDKQERSLFRLLISVSGVGAAVARMILSSLQSEELQNAIAQGNTTILKSVKGIGLKTAQRIIVDLKDKIGQPDTADNQIYISKNTSKDEALSAMLNLGFTKASVEKLLDKIIAANPNASVEEIIKEALKM
jgi:Holliday junction DNA helicase RuvA